MDWICEVQGKLKGLLELVAERMRQFYDKWVGEALDYVEGDCVYLKRADLHSDRPNKKLNFKQFGPFRILQKISGTAYWVLLDGWAIHNVFYVSCLILA